jgi:predicted DNA-binding protein with PD1-like motif
MLVGTFDTIKISFVDCKKESPSKLDVNEQLDELTVISTTTRR